MTYHGVLVTCISIYHDKSGTSITEETNLPNDMLHNYTILQVPYTQAYPLV